LAALASVLANPGFYMTYAVIQALVVLFVIRLFDAYEREPLSLVVLMAIWGATGAAALALAGNEAVRHVLSPDASIVFGNAVAPPVIEESAKGLARSGITAPLRHRHRPGDHPFSPLEGGAAKRQGDLREMRRAAVAVGARSRGDRLVPLLGADLWGAFHLQEE
jgi:hypothetical protein